MNPLTSYYIFKELEKPQSKATSTMLTLSICLFCLMVYQEWMKAEEKKERGYCR